MRGRGDMSLAALKATELAHHNNINLIALDNAVELKTALSGLFKLNNYFRPWLAEKYADYCVASHVMALLVYLDCKTLKSR